MFKKVATLDSLFVNARNCCSLSENGYKLMMFVYANVRKSDVRKAGLTCIMIFDIFILLFLL